MLFHVSTCACTWHHSHSVPPLPLQHPAGDTTPCGYLFFPSCFLGHLFNLGVRGVQKLPEDLLQGGLCQQKWLLCRVSESEALQPGASYRVSLRIHQSSRGLDIVPPQQKEADIIIIAERCEDVVMGICTSWPKATLHTHLKSTYYVTFLKYLVYQGHCIHAIRLS